MHAIKAIKNLISQMEEGKLTETEALAGIVETGLAALDDNGPETARMIPQEVSNAKLN